MKEQDIRPEVLFNEYLRLAKASARTMFRRDVPVRIIACPVCGGRDQKQEFVKDGFSYVRCRACTTLYNSPRHPFSAFKRYYGDSPAARYWAGVFSPAVEPARRKLIYRPKAREIARILRQAGMRRLRAVGDIGAGTGVMLEELRRLKVANRYVAIEPSASAALVLRRKRLELVASAAEDAAKGFRGKLDAAVCMELFEHAFDPERLLRAIGAMLRPGGILVMTTLNCAGFDIAVLGKKAKAVQPPFHLNFAAAGSIGILLQRCGFSEISVTTPGKLDVDIVLNAQRRGETTDPFVAELAKLDAGGRQKFQDYLVRHNLSSHMWVVARRPGRR